MKTVVSVALDTILGGIDPVKEATYIRISASVVGVSSNGEEGGASEVRMQERS